VAEHLGFSTIVTGEQIILSKHRSVVMVAPCRIFSSHPRKRREGLHPRLFEHHIYLRGGADGVEFGDGVGRNLQRGGF
jgi:hypothetical protein